MRGRWSDARNSVSFAPNRVHTITHGEDIVPTVKAIDKLADILANSENFLQKMHELGQAPAQKKEFQRLFSPSEAADMVGRDRTTLARAEKELGIEPPTRPGSNRRLGYTLQQIMAFRGHFGTLPWRTETDPAIILGCQSFKGGVGKSTTCVNLAHYLALKGYRVLVIDTDSQATTTSMFGYVPDVEFTEADTILPYLAGEQNTLHYAIRPTYFPNISLIPACLKLYDAEIAIVTHLMELRPEQRPEFFSELRYGIETITKEFDVILLDSPPALGMISLSTLLAADALIVPSAARMFDFSSTVQFFRMIYTYINTILPDKTYRWISVLTTLFDQRYASQRDFVDVMRTCFGDSVFQRVFFHSSEVINAAATFRTPYEDTHPPRRVLEMMNSVFQEIEYAILREWPSKREELRSKGII